MAAKGFEHRTGVLRSMLATLMLGGAVSGCAVGTAPLSLDDHIKGGRTDLAAMFAKQEPVAGPIGLYDAMARAVRHNLDSRLRAMEAAMAQDQARLATYDLLPRVDARYGVEERNNVNAASSQSILSGRESLEPSTSQDEQREIGDVRAVWNVLDFGVAYVAARQASDRAKIAAERRRKVVHQIVQDVRAAYWRAVAAQRLLARVDPLTRKVQRALANSARIERMRLQSPTQALAYQRDLLDSLRQLQSLRRDLTLAKTELAALMNLPPQTDFQVEMLNADDFGMIELTLTPEEIEILALAHRPELREERYQTRISRAETRRALLRMLPGIELNSSANYDSNSFLVNNTWASYGAAATWNLFNLVNGPQRVRTAAAAARVAHARRMAVSMAVLVQAHVSYINYRNAEEDFKIAARLRDIDARMLQQLHAQGGASAIGELSVIRGELNLLISDLRRDLAYADMNNASGAVLLSIGADPMPDTVIDGSLMTLAAAIRDTEEAWRRGVFTVSNQHTAEPPALSARPSPARDILGANEQTAAMRRNL